MAFKELYDFRQGLGERVEPADIRRKLRELFPARPVRVVKTRMDPELLMGCYLSPRNEDTAFYGAPAGAALVVLSASLNLCWSRYVEVKELMHVLDDPLRATNTAQEFEDLLVGMCEDLGGDSSRNHQIRSEIECLWMSLGLMCREADRLDFLALRESGQIRDIELAERLKMPERFVPMLFSAGYKNNISWLTENR